MEPDLDKVFFLTGVYINVVSVDIQTKSASSSAFHFHFFMSCAVVGSLAGLPDQNLLSKSDLHYDPEKM